MYNNAQHNRERVEREHREMVEAILDRDAERLIRAMAEHRTHAVEALSAIIEPAPEE